MALTGVDLTTGIADHYLDYYLPANEDDENEVQQSKFFLLYFIL